jgi:hypothetical protein
MKTPLEASLVKRVTGKGFVVLALLGLVVIALQSVSECWAQVGGPYVPPRSSIEITAKTNDAVVMTAVSVDLPNPCMSVNWGQASLSGNTVFVNAQFSWSALICAQVITTVSTQYNLRTLPPGNYNFVFEAWGTQVQTQAFSVLAPQPTLKIVQDGRGQGRLSWPTNAAAFSLECTTNLPLVEWATVTNSPAVEGTQFVLPINLGDPRRFYRLRSR